LSIYVSHFNSQTVDAITRYFASEDDLETVACFLDFHEIKDSPKKMQNPVMNFLLSGHVAQSESQNPFNYTCELEGKKSPNAGEILMYLTTLIAASW